MWILCLIIFYQEGDAWLGVKESEVASTAHGENLLILNLVLNFYEIRSCLP